MIIDCDTCEVRDLACGDCVVNVLLGAPGEPPYGPAAAPPAPLELDDEHRGALDVLAGSGLVPPLRLVVGVTAPTAQAGPAAPVPPSSAVG